MSEDDKKYSGTPEGIDMAVSACIYWLHEWQHASVSFLSKAPPAITDSTASA